MARNAVVLFSLVLAVVCLLQVATAFNLGQAIQNKAQNLIQSEHLACGSYSAFCDSNLYAFANVKDADGNDVSSQICKVAIGAVLGC